MIIRKKRIRSLKADTRLKSKTGQIFAGLRNLEMHKEKLFSIGFSKNLEAGEKLLPGVIGSVTRFNAEGDYQIHKDQPKETAYRMAEWKWQEFRGRYDKIERSKIVEIPYERYPRTFIPPPSIELCIAQNSLGEKILTSPIFSVSEISSDIRIHAVNVFLEIFGECELFNADNTPLQEVKIIRLNWLILPKGQMPWDKLEKHLKKVIEHEPEGNKTILSARHEAISKQNPEFVAVGQGGFGDYVVFCFPSKSLYILESRKVNNATYVLEKDWEELSAMSKAELIRENLHKERIIHRDTWFAKIGKLLK